MKIGIHASNNRSAGGQFQYLVMFLEALSQISRDLPNNKDLEISLLFLNDEQNLGRRYQELGWQIINLGELLGLSSVAEGDRRETLRSTLSKIPAILGDQHKLDFLYFPTWTENCHLWGLPFAFAVHDLQHRLQPEFPEVSLGQDLGGSWQWREQFFSAAFKQAAFSIVDSETGVEHAQRFYEVADNQCEVLPSTIPFRLGSDESKTAEIKIPDKFFFYPAQLWPHKNHYRVVEALGLLESEHGQQCDLVFSGGEFPLWPIRRNCQALAQRLGIAHRVHFLGYVSDAQIDLLYSKALALVMPTFFGPTNIPYIEAFAAGCPVIGSDLPGIRQQIGQAGLLVDPRESRSIASAMSKLVANKKLCRQLSELGRQRFAEFSPTKFAQRLSDILTSHNHLTKF